MNKKKSVLLLGFFFLKNVLIRFKGLNNTLQSPQWPPTNLFLFLYNEQQQHKKNKLLTGRQRAACPGEQRPQWRGRGGTTGWWWTSWNWAGRPLGSSKSSSTYTYRQRDIQYTKSLWHGQCSWHEDRHFWGLTWWLWRSWAVSVPAGHWSQMMPQVLWQPRSPQKYCQ